MSATAACSCGQLSVRCPDLVRTSICHCRECQRRTGSVFGVQTRFQRNQVEITGNSSCYERIGDAGGRITLHFCPTCGSTVFWTIDAMPDSIAVAVGCFAAADSPSPVFSVYEARKHSWVVLPNSIEDHWD